MSRKEIPLGIQDFKKIRDRDLLFVDKSALIDKILGMNGIEVFLFTRPRRFGKSINLSMLDAYLSNEYKGNTWFDGLDISRIRPDDADKNSNIVVYLDMKDLGDGTYTDFLKKMSMKIRFLYAKYSYLLKTDKVDRSIVSAFSDIYEQNEDADMTQALNVLVAMLGIHHNQDVIVLIDEYDNAVNHSSGTEEKKPSDRRKILDFVKSFLSPILKGNDHIRFAVLTGIMRIGKESIFSGLNNLLVDNVFKPKFDEYFGFTTSEVKALCDDYGHPEKFDEARYWYDGYRFGGAEVYNPWSILNYMFMDFLPGTYWAGTSGNDIISRMLNGLDADLYTKIEKLSKHEHLVEHIDETIVYSDLTEGSKDLIPVMVMSGYLTAVRTDEPDYYEISIPNREMEAVFRNKFDEQLGSTGTRIRELEKAVIHGDREGLAEALKSFAMSIDPKIMSHEHSYEILCISLLMHLEGPYEVQNEIHRGKGYCDILLKSNDRSLPHCLIELKRWKPGDPDDDALAESGLRQIHDKAYTHMLNGTVILYGIAFHGTDATVHSETVTLRSGQ